MEEKIKVAVVGAGYTAREHIKAFQDIENVKIEGIFSRTKEKALKLKEEYNIGIVAESLEELWDRTKADLVVITVNELSMANMIIESLKYGWAILCEKPPALYVEEAENILNFAKREGKDVKVALNRASYSVTLKVREELNLIEGKRVIIVQDQEDPERAYQMGRPQEVTKRWMYANSIHLIDYFRIFGRGEVRKVETFGELNFLKPCFIEAHIEFSSGDYGVYLAFWNEPAPWFVSINLPDLRYEFRPLEEGRKQIRGEKPIELKVHEWDKKFKPGFRKQAEEMVKFVMKKDGKIPSLEDSIFTLKLIKEIYKT